jgi:hypothetical protein
MIVVNLQNIRFFLYIQDINVNIKLHTLCANTNNAPSVGCPLTCSSITWELLQTAPISIKLLIEGCVSYLTN